MSLEFLRFNRLVITGASGFIGAQIVPRLMADRIDLLLVGRDVARLQLQYPGATCCDYDGLAAALRADDLLIHMAVMNNDKAGSDSRDAFRAVNVDLLAEVLQAARAANLRRVVNLTSFHALGAGGSAYAESKRDALALTRSETGPQVVNLFLPAAYGERFAGRLAMLNRLPAALRKPALSVLSSLMATVHVDRIRAFLTTSMDTKIAVPEVFLAEPQLANPVFRVGKRLIDLAFALAILVPFSWLIVALWLLIRLDSPGPGIFAQPRIGRGGRVFTCYKFRTMRTGTKQVGTHEVAANAVTRTGAILRRTKLDELPQAWNLLVGNMSLVGPRPCLPVQTTLIEERRRRGVLEALPGITGLAQINNIDMSDPVLLAEWDARSIAQQGLLPEIKIILRTFLGGGQGDKVRV